MVPTNAEKHVHTPGELLTGWLTARLSPRETTWLNESLATARAGDRPRFQLAFGLTSRKVPHAVLALTAAEVQQANHARAGWRPDLWSIDQAVRVLLVLSWPDDDGAAYQAELDRLFAAGSVAELIALYQGLCVLPFPERFAGRAAEGIRSNMKTVFEAVAHQNPYAADVLDEGAWNQMVLKCLFTGALLEPVIGIDRRTNERLATMLCDYAHERWAAKRTISPELWRCVGPVAGPKGIQDLARVLESGSELEQQAAVLALRANRLDAAKDVLATVPQLNDAALAGHFSWQTIAATLAAA